MSVMETNEIVEILDRVKSWSAARIALARRILESLEAPQVSEPPRTKSLKDIVGLLKTDAPPPSDEECRNIRDEELIKKYLR
jgi:hypothetical protein